ncbi:hypothetical protein BKA70DRAFT_1214641 [Coprinopsis sp. MPI-PUGE-AT-0042]|nr:hypothetical protein BKA70DRAFT_1214641 [Coprinopsis sp. MPI-PUGE-AT-0042]
MVNQVTTYINVHQTKDNRTFTLGVLAVPPAWMHILACNKLDKVQVTVTENIITPNLDTPILEIVILRDWWEEYYMTMFWVIFVWLNQEHLGVGKWTKAECLECIRILDGKGTNRTLASAMLPNMLCISKGAEHFFGLVQAEKAQKSPEKPKRRQAEQLMHDQNAPKVRHHKDKGWALIGKGLAFWAFHFSACCKPKREKSGKVISAFADVPFLVPGVLLVSGSDQVLGGGEEQRDEHSSEPEHATLQETGKRRSRQTGKCQRQTRKQSLIYIRKQPIISEVH